MSKLKLGVAALWFNVNRAGDYNHAHIHTDSFLSGVYYVDAGPAPAAELVLLDPRVQIQQFEYMGWFGMGQHRRVRPQSGKLVLFPSWLSHRVEATPDGNIDTNISNMAPSAAEAGSFDSGARISVSFNLQLFHKSDSSSSTCDDSGKL